jgi:hypothetical protein
VEWIQKWYHYMDNIWWVLWTSEAENQEIAAVEQCSSNHAGRPEKTAER